MGFRRNRDVTEVLFEVSKGLRCITWGLRGFKEAYGAISEEFRWFSAGFRGLTTFSWASEGLRCFTGIRQGFGEFTKILRIFSWFHRRHRGVFGKV